MPLTDAQAETVVQASISDAGGGTGPHHDGKTLFEAGLKLPDQRSSFRRRASINVERFEHTLQPEQVPADAGTSVAAARKAVKDNALPR